MLDFPIDLARLVGQVTRLADAVERLVEVAERLLPPLADAPEIRQATLEDLRTIDSEAQEREKEQRRELAARFGVVPDSPAFEAALREYEAEMRRLHGDAGTVNWDEAFAQVNAATFEAFVAARKL
ncbi:MAG TPA: hypothetical protein VEL77_15345 [Rugosimonospora sp.]|nr:hypothetical protein [Rugosimonospora sp.]